MGVAGGSRDEGNMRNHVNRGGGEMGLHGEGSWCCSRGGRRNHVGCWLQNKKVCSKLARGAEREPSCISIGTLLQWL